jgi:uncharacterized protein (TIGR00369 family)
MTDALTETIFDRFPRPPCADLLGWTLLEQDPVRGWIKLAFQAKPEFLNPAGFVQGGLIAAMLDDTMGPAALIMSGGRLYTATIDMNVSFLAPARAGRLIGEGQVLQMGKSVAFLKGKLTDETGTVVARATSSAKLVPTEKLPG